MNDLASIVKLKNKDLPTMQSQPIVWSFTQTQASEDYISDDQGSEQNFSLEIKSYLC